LEGKFTDIGELKKATELIDKILDKGIVEFNKLKLYLKILKEKFKKPSYNKFSLLRQINELKFEERVGWLRLEFKKIEAVTSHTLNAFYIASLLLPNSSNDLDEHGYNKNKIMNMLLYHDLAECTIHDHLPEDKTEEVKEEENEFYEQLSMHKVYGIHNTIQIYDLWKAFEGRNCINSKIAYDIDKLEAYAQLLSYLASGEKITKEEFKKWRDDINDKIDTKHGKRIKKYIESEFKSIIDKYSSI